MVRKCFLLALFLALVQAAPARAVEPAAVNAAIDRGVAGLKQLQWDNGTWSYPPTGEIGATALAALTLLECGVPANDPSIVHATRAIRQASPRETRTYSLSLSILFLDRLGDPNDVPLIESLTVRLLAGQNPADGGWTYTCPSISDAEARRLAGAANQDKVLVGRRGDHADRPRRTAQDLPEAIQGQLRQVQQAQQGGGAAIAANMGPSDNSNTQFATLALWIARRHGLPVEKALARIEQRFRRSQNEDGGWAYNPPQGVMNPGSFSTPSMTCAGLLALAVANGAGIELAKNKQAQAKLAKRDPAVNKGLLALAGVIGDPVGARGQVPQVGGRSFYFLWSLERVAVALGLETIGKKDWYNWGAEILLANQQRNGVWIGSWGECGADTCFALLFLKRANLAQDLTRQLRGSVTDPGRVLRGTRGQPGATALKPALDPRNARTEDRPRAEPRPVQEPAVTPAATPLTGFAAELTKASATEQDQMLERHRDAKGAEHTEALASAIPQLQGDLKKRTRHALVERLTRMKATTLLKYLKDEDTEIRRAAALALAYKDARETISDLIPLLNDPQEVVVRAAHSALKALTGKDFGPAAGASADERRQAIEAWKEWAQQHGG